MTRRALLTAAAVIAATVVCLGALPMRTDALPALGIWAGSVVVAVLLGGALSAALERRDHRAIYSAIWREARRALR